MKSSAKRSKSTAGKAVSRIKSPATKPVKTTRAAIKKAVRIVSRRQAAGTR